MALRYCAIITFPLPAATAAGGIKRTAAECVNVAMLDDVLIAE
jgi:hypothetical protein